ncbi:hypothetical protein [Winogradskyella luteola]|uniref:Lipoprotein n=1 Tax=Winogradskyella luteola TaxID=2828330 RepID=A0A9X1JPY9_9FLAO|nr:hypothetical protein [Winogradskyella luteola]MBV7268418.1 hypothetical protein [Winogradskyella luteola]
MNRYFYLLLILLTLSCNNERVLQLPEIENAEITKVLDVSPAYIFYDETQPDSTLLNRKNLISTTNWLVNVDKRLTLRQAIPHIKFLQDKKRNAEIHMNENAKNYFTCNDTSIGNLGFVEFTDVDFITNINSYENNQNIDNEIRTVYIHFFSNDVFSITELFGGKQTKEETMALKPYFNKDYFDSYRENKNKITLSFDKRLSFQSYINLKHKVLMFTNEMSEISNDEIIY